MSKAGKDGISALIKKYNSSDSNLQDSRSRKSTVISKDLMKTINSKLGDTGFVDEAVKFAPRKPLPALVVQPHPPSRRDFKAIGSKDFFCETPSNVETIIRSRVANRIAEMNLTPIGNRLSRNSPPSPTQEALGISSTQSPSRNSTKSRLQAEKSAQTKERLREFAQEEKHAIDEDTGETLETKFVGIEVSESANDSSTASSLNTVELDSLALNEKLISFVSLIGMDHDQIFGLEDLSIMSDNFVAHLKGLSLPTKELEIAPALTKRKNIYPPGLSLFVFPKGATLQTSQRKPFFHQFVLTIADGSRLYGHSVSIPIKSNDEDLTKCRSMIGSYLLRNPHAEIEFAQMPSEFYFPRALVILSPHPYHNSFLRILQDYVEMIASEGILSSHVSLLYEKLNAPAPLYSINSVEISLFSQAKILFRTPNFSEPPLCDLNFGILFRYLEPRHAILILNALLCECPVIIKSHHIELLTPCCEALLALLYPFKWPFLYIPVLPKSLIDILQAPQPFLIGAYSKLLDHCDPVSHVWVVDLDRSRITPPSKNAPQFVELPWRLVWRLFRSINMHMNYYKFYHPRSKIIHPDCLPENATNNDQELDISSSFLGSKSILSYKTVSDLFSGSESEENDSNLKSKGNDFLNPDLWIHPGEYSQSGMQSDNSLNSPEGKQLSSPLAEYRNAFSYHNNSDVLSIANGSSQESEEVRRGTKPLNHSLPVDRQSVSKRASRYIRSSRLRFFSVDRHSSDDDEMQNENTKFNGRVPLKVDVLKFRSQCLSIYVSLLAKYREYIQISEEPVEEEIISLFNTSACLKEVDNTKRVRHLFTHNLSKYMADTNLKTVFTLGLFILLF